MFSFAKIQILIIMLFSCVLNAQVQFTSIPADLQMIPRNKNNVGVVELKGKCLTGNYTILHTKLRVHSTGNIVADSSSSIYPDSSFSITHHLPVQLNEYDLEISLKNTNSEVFEKKITRLTTGDHFLITGQSNALAAAGFDSISMAQNTMYSKPWLRGIGSNEDPFSTTFPCTPVDLNYYQSVANWLYNGFVGTWGLKLQHDLSQQTGIPNCMINGARGGSSISELLPSKSPTKPDSLDPCNVYDKVYKKIANYNLNKSIKAIFWYQGETDAIFSIDETNEYTNRFRKLYNSWKADYPNIEKIFLLQLNTGCNEIHLGQMREIQRKLSHEYNDVVIMSTFSTDTADRYYDRCHYTVQGYNKIADNLLPLVKKHIYDNAIDENLISAPEITNAYISEPNQLCIEFNIDISFQASMYYLYPNEGVAYLKDYFYSENYKQIKVNSISALSNKLYLNLDPDSALPKKITYLPHSFTRIPTLYVGPWILNKNNTNIAALSFYDFPVIRQKYNFFDIYPNPSSDHVIIDIEENGTHTNVSIFDMMGKLLFQQDIQNKTKIQLNPLLPKGIYIIKVENEFGQANKKLILK